MADHHCIGFIYQEVMVRIEYKIWTHFMQWDFAKTN
jgi:hypothetical protein